MPVVFRKSSDAHAAFCASGAHDHGSMAFDSGNSLESNQFDIARAANSEGRNINNNCVSTQLFCMYPCRHLQMLNYGFHAKAVISITFNEPKRGSIGANIMT